MKCLEALDHLSAYLDDTLEPGLRKQLEQHLARCPSCHREVDELRATVELCRTLPEVAPPPGFGEAVGRAVRRHAAFPPSRRRRLGDLWARFGYRGVAAAAAVLVLAVVLNQALDNPFTLRADVADTTEEARRLHLDVKTAGSSGGGEPESALPATKDAPAGTVETQPELWVPADERKIIRNADVELAVEDFDRAFQDIVFLAEAAGGYVESSSFWKGEEGRKGGSLRLRVPQQNFRTVLARIEEKGQVLSRNLYGQDVTQAYVDTDARLKALELQEQQLGQIMARANTVGEVLQVQAELGRVRAQIESLTAVLRNYDRLVSFSTIAVNLVPPREPVPPPVEGLWARMVDAFLRSLKWLLGAVERLLVIAASAFPLVALAVLGYAGWRLRRRRSHS